MDTIKYNSVNSDPNACPKKGVLKQTNRVDLTSRPRLQILSSPVLRSGPVSVAKPSKHLFNVFDGVAHPNKAALSLKAKPNLKQLWLPPGVSGRIYDSPKTLVAASQAPQASQTRGGGEGPAVKLKNLLSESVKRESKLVTGRLDNGMEYVILPNKLPPKRFEAHLEIHAGSVDEQPDEQGMAHLVEHVTFLGSRKRENLLGTGARANAYTDFHHTVFHVHAPLTGSVGENMIPRVLEALREVAFEPQFLEERIEKERKAVTAEAQMMNTIEYRVDCQLLQFLHAENNLSCRFPIGHMDQVQRWTREQLLKFWGKWYFPANATLYLVGDFERDAKDVVSWVNDCFGRIPAPRVGSPLPSATFSPSDMAASWISKRAEGGSKASSLFTSLMGGGANSGGAGAGGQNTAANAAEGNVATPPLKTKHSVRPPVEHLFGYGSLAPATAVPSQVPISVFRHPLLQQFMLTLFCKLPIQPMTRMGDLRVLLMLRIILSVFQFRINGRYVQADPPFQAISLDVSDSSREGCAVSTLTITAEPSGWAGAVRVAVEESRRVQQHGLTEGELSRYLQAILRDSSQLAGQADKIPSIDTLNFVMEGLSCGHVVMSHRDAHEALLKVAETVTLSDVNALCRSVMAFAAFYGQEEELVQEAAGNPAAFAGLGPTRCTSVVACLPAYVDNEGHSISQGAVSGRGANLNPASGHLDADTIDLEQIKSQMKQQEEQEAKAAPPGARTFDLPSEEIIKALRADGLTVTPPLDIELPSVLLSDKEVAELVLSRRPSFAPVRVGTRSMVHPSTCPNTGVVQRRLANGIYVNYRHTDNEPSGGLIRVLFNGGRLAEKVGAAADGFGAVAVGVRALSESGAVGRWSREQVEMFCVSNLVNCALDSDEENIVLDVHFVVDNGGMKSAFQFLHLFLDQPVWDDHAVTRAKAAFLTGQKLTQKSLERASVERVMSAMLGPDRCFRDPTPEELQALTLDGIKQRLSSLMHTGNMEVEVVGDFDPRQLEEYLLTYLGTVRPQPSPLPITSHPLKFRNPPRPERHQRWHLQDSDERACAYIGGRAPVRWGPINGLAGANHLGVINTSSITPSAIAASLERDAQPLGPLVGSVLPPVGEKAIMTNATRQAVTAARRAHPLFRSVILGLLAEIINSRLFTTVRDTLGLTYDVDFETTMFDRIRYSWFMVHVTSHPSQIEAALNASASVLRDVAAQPISRHELLRAKTTLLTRHDSDLKDNNYWIGLLSHLQNPLVPHKVLDCLRDLKAMYECATVEDVSLLYAQFDLRDDAIFTCVGTSGSKNPLEAATK
uniref:Mitochondrial processing peptidase n=1 Tax=Polytomella parva TaxID=51329 RepID=A0A6U0W9G0_9CHLO